MFVHMFVRDLLRRLWTDWHQTRHEGRGLVDLEPKGIGHHGNQYATMATNKRCFWRPDQHKC